MWDGIKTTRTALPQLLLVVAALTAPTGPELATGAASDAPAMPFAVPLLRTTNESAAISAAWVNTHELRRQDTQSEWWCVFCHVGFLLAPLGNGCLGRSWVLGCFWVSGRRGLVWAVSCLVWGLVGFLAGVCAGLSGPVHV